MIIFSDKLFTKPIKTIKAFTSDELKRAFDEIEKLGKKYYLAGYIRYEAFSITSSELPLLYFEVFENYEQFLPDTSRNFVLNPKPCISFEEYIRSQLHL